MDEFYQRKELAYRCLIDAARSLSGAADIDELVGQIFLNHYATRWEAPATATPGLLVRSISPEDRSCT